MPPYLECYVSGDETHHTFSYSPIYDDEGRIFGTLCVVIEVTDRVIGERRVRVLRDLAVSRTEAAEEACEILRYRAPRPPRKPASVSARYSPAIRSMLDVPFCRRVYPFRDTQIRPEKRFGRSDQSFQAAQQSSERRHWGSAHRLLAGRGIVHDLWEAGLRFGQRA